MSQEPGDSQAPVDWRKVHALGLPSGSVRAILALLVFATTWGLVLLEPTREVPDYLRDLLFIIMGHYFAVRYRNMSQESESGPPPLFLPRGSVRLILIAGCLGVAVLLFRRGQLTAPERHPAVVTLILVGGFLLGVAFNALSAWWRGRGHPPSRLGEDLRALASMAAAVLLTILVWNRIFEFFPRGPLDNLFARWIRLGRYGPEHILAALVGFYFGTRS